MLVIFSAFVLAAGMSVSQANLNYFETIYVQPDLRHEHHRHHLPRNALRIERFKWPSAEVPYVFDESYDDAEKQSVLEAMQVFDLETCVRFVPKVPRAEMEHIRFEKSAGCGSNIGFRANRTEPLLVTFSPFCLQLRGAMQHELLHVLGLLHEQSRPDRDQYVRIVWANIDPQFVQNFGRADWGTVETFGLPYDYDSLMHYPGNAFAKSRDQNVTIFALDDPDRNLGQSEAPTFYDLEKIRQMYHC